jgi:hypothetical protein
VINRTNDYYATTVAKSFFYVTIRLIISKMKEIYQWQKSF